MTDEVLVDQPGVAATTSTLAEKASNITSNAGNVGQALTDAVNAARTAPLATSISALAEKFSGQIPAIGERVDTLRTGLQSAASSMMEADDTMAGAVRKMMQ